MKADPRKLRRQQAEWGLDLTGPEPVPMMQGETGDAAPPESTSVPPYGQWGLDLTGPEPVPMAAEEAAPVAVPPAQWGLDLTGAEPRPMALSESQWGLDLTGEEPVPMMDYDSPEAPPPDAAPVGAPTASSRATRGSILDQLAAPLTQDERAVLEDPRASASAEAFRRMAGSVSNRMMALAGLPTQPVGESPFVSERDKLRQFILQRSGIAERQEAGEEARDIRREQLAAAEAARLRAEKAAALARGDEAAAKEADRKLRERGLELEARRVSLMEKKAATPKPQTATGENLKAASELRKEFNALPEVKTYKDATVSFEKIKNTATDPSAAGDLALIFSFMKVLDPGSTVREGEFAAAAAAAGVDERIVASINKAVSGQKLSMGQRADFLKQAEKFYAAHRSQYESTRANYRRLAERMNATPDDVTGPDAMSGNGTSTKAPTGPMKMRFPDGSVHDVEPEDMSEAAARGAVPNG